MSTSYATPTPTPRVRADGGESAGLSRAPIRWLLVLSLLGCTLLAQWFIERHLAPASALPPGELAHPLAALPLAIDGWRGEDRQVLDERALYADQHLNRGYVNADGQQAALVWMAYSASGADRGHHPEVCMAVAGRPEDVSARREIEVPGHAAPIQQYRFGHEGDRQLVFYWYYTLPTDGAEKLDGFQRAFRRFRSRPASVTVEVFAPEIDQFSAAAAQRFVAALDKQIQTLVGPTAVRGSQRIPVTVIPTTEPAG
ncbi:MAG: exosortase-associated EpsI family protein [Planctomycetales bacterium]|nr:exosortase-associated EpsI family protein [Planctomycetales bacterium]